jgi:hypothetical protein
MFTLLTLLGMLRWQAANEAPGYGATMPSQVLTGSSAAPGSLVALQPGQSIRVRFRQAYGDTKRLAKPGTRLLYRAFVHTYEGAKSASDVISNNTISVSP